MKILLGMILVVLLSGCMSTADGPFYQTEGRPIDYEAVDRLVENKATKAEVVVALGAPTKTAMLGSNEILKYVSVKRRESVSKVAGIRVSGSKQTMEEEVTLTFDSGTLVQRHKAHVIR